MNRLKGILTAVLISCSSALVPRNAIAQLETRSQSPSIYSPLKLGVGDFNHDGKLDVAAAGFGNRIGAGSGVAVLLSNGNGTFRPPVNYVVSSQSESVNDLAVADFNRDGNLDLSVADYLDRSISILLGNTDGTFQTPLLIPTTANPTSVVVGDLNGDGLPDLIICDSPYISTMLGNGDGTFQSPIDNDSFSPNVPAALAVGDFNHDGKLDVAVVGGFGSGDFLGVMLGNGDGTLQSPTLYSIGGMPSSIAVADFNGDHKLDLAVANGFGATVFLGDGDGTFQNGVSYPYSNPGPLRVADFNGDGKLDLVGDDVNPVGNDSVSILLGNGDGTFQPAVSYPAGEEISDVEVGDFNGDHQPDVVVADFLAVTVRVLANTGVVSFNPTTPLTFPVQLVGTTSTHQHVTLTNTGTKALSIAGTKISGPFQLASGTTCGSSVSPGAKCTLSVVFDPKGIGTTNGLLSISDSASSKPQVIELSGVGTVISLAPTSLNFGTQKVGTKSSPQGVTVANTGSTTVSVTSVTITGANSKDYSQTNTCGQQIGPGGTCTVSVTFAPTKTGTRTALAQINDNGGGGSQAATLTGVGD